MTESLISTGIYQKSAEDSSGLAYRMKLDGLILKEDTVSRATNNDIIKIHLHAGAPGKNGLTP